LLERLALWFLITAIITKCYVSGKMLTRKTEE
jgi:hypothetical protein